MTPIPDPTPKPSQATQAQGAALAPGPPGAGLAVPVPAWVEVALGRVGAPVQGRARPAMGEELQPAG